jgi:hypothetical protein
MHASLYILFVCCVISRTAKTYKNERDFEGKTSKQAYLTTFVQLNYNTGHSLNEQEQE